MVVIIYNVCYTGSGFWKSLFDMGLEKAMSQETLRVAKANYGLDAPGLVRNFLIGGGMQDVNVSGRSFWIYPPVRVATGVKK